MPTAGIGGMTINRYSPGIESKAATYGFGMYFTALISSAIIGYASIANANGPDWVVHPALSSLMYLFGSYPLIKYSAAFKLEKEKEPPVNTHTCCSFFVQNASVAYVSSLALKVAFIAFGDLLRGATPYERSDSKINIGYEALSCIIPALAIAALTEVQHAKLAQDAADSQQQLLNAA
jgi:hypothetical protein